MITEVHDPYKLIQKLHKRESEWADFFRVAGEDGPARLKAQAWQWRDELKDRGKELELQEVEDALLELGHEYLGHEDPRQVLFRELGIWASKQPQSVKDLLAAELEDGFQDAWEASPDLGSFRRYLRGRCEAALEVAA